MSVFSLFSIFCNYFNVCNVLNYNFGGILVNFIIFLIHNVFSHSFLFSETKTKSPTNIYQMHCGMKQSLYFTYFPELYFPFFSSMTRQGENPP